MPPHNDLEPRQVWAKPSPTVTSSLTPCTAFRLPSDGAIVINETVTITLDQDAFFQPMCTSYADVDNSTIIDVEDSLVLDLRDPYFASTSPVMYVLGAMNVTAWVLLVMLCITPRTFIIGGLGGGTVGGQRKSGGSMRGLPMVGVGGRPWLQKAATLTVAISLLIATVRCFQIAEAQYSGGYQDSSELTTIVMQSTEIIAIRAVSRIAEYLAQVQTLLRLFQRQREKVTIKWLGFALIILDLIFTVLSNVLYLRKIDGTKHIRPRQYVDALPALAYLFELALALLYAGAVIFYSINKRRFAYYHPKMHSVSLVAVLAMSSILIPVIFFINDIAIPEAVAWGDYVRWVGGAAASVVVWEWVERIEALEREERKDGILGREIFEFDGMLEIVPDIEMREPRQRYSTSGGGSFSGGAFSTKSTGRSSDTNHSRARPFVFKKKGKKPQRPNSNMGRAHATDAGDGADQSRIPPSQSASPVNRSDSNSAASTIYALMNRPANSTPSTVPSVSYQTVAEHTMPPMQSTDFALTSGAQALSLVPALGRPWISNLIHPFKRRHSLQPKRNVTPAVISSIPTEVKKKRQPSGGPKMTYQLPLANHESIMPEDTVDGPALVEETVQQWTSTPPTTETEQQKLENTELTATKPRNVRQTTQILDNNESSQRPVSNARVTFAENDQTNVKNSPSNWRPP